MGLHEWMGQKEVYVSCLPLKRSNPKNFSKRRVGSQFGVGKKETQQGKPFLFRYVDIYIYVYIYIYIYMRWGGVAGKPNRMTVILAHRQEATRRFPYVRAQNPWSPTQVTGSTGKNVHGRSVSEKD